jgi:hypothetical protein
VEVYEERQAELPAGVHDGDAGRAELCEHEVNALAPEEFDVGRRDAPRV